VALQIGPQLGIARKAFGDEVAAAKHVGRFVAEWQGKVFAVHRQDPQQGYKKSPAQGGA
jgi:hypothetical protein